ncbi:MAG: long-chain fatty acid--CoA ligase [Candidatus Heimdallarchaeota archaeon]|nr:long-chain fatty acid--CoA ligase [Candidatus Heimdallarchaeota archaeon]
MVKPEDIPLYPQDVPKTIDYPVFPLYQYLDDAERDFPNNEAFILETQSFDKIAKVTYAELGKYTDIFAAFLAAKGIGPGDKIGVFLPNMIEFVIAYYGILKAGATVVSLNFQYPPSELRGQLKQSQAKGIVCADMITPAAQPYETCKEIRDQVGFIVVASIKPYLSGIKGILGSLLGKISKKDSRDYYLHEIYDQYGRDQRPKIQAPKPEDVAVIMFTGGTTGTPKGAMLTQKNLVSNVVQCSVWMQPPLERGQVNGIGSLPFYHSYGATTSMNLGIYLASRMICMMDPREDKFNQILYLLEKYKVHLFNTVPTLYIALLNHPRLREFDLNNLMYGTSGAAPLPIAVIEEFEKRTGANIAEGYGLTETSPVTHINPMAPAPGKKKPWKKNGSIGLPIPDTDVVVVDIGTGNKLLEQNEEGEIAIHGPQVFAGYYLNEDATKEVTRVFNGKNYFLTGDIGKFDEDFYFYITDRKKDMIDVGGFKAYPREIEDVLIAHPKISNAACIGVPHPKVGETVKLFIVPKPETDLTKAEVLSYCQEKLVKYKQPHSEEYIEFRDELPMTQVGKVLRRALKEEEGQ